MFFSEAEIVVRSFTSDDVDGAILQDIETICATAQKESKPFAKNMFLDKDRPGTLINIIANKKRFNRENGFFSIVYDSISSAPIGFSGCYYLDNARQILICGVRLWVSGKYRMKYVHSLYTYPQQFEYARKNEASCCILTFNDYNLSLRKIIQRIKNRKVVSLGVPSRTIDVYDTFHFPNDQYRIQYVDQYLAVLPIKSSTLESLKLLNTYKVKVR